MLPTGSKLKLHDFKGIDCGRAQNVMFQLAGAVLVPWLLHSPCVMAILRMKAFMVLLAFALLLKRVFRELQVTRIWCLIFPDMHGSYLAHLPCCWLEAVASTAV